MIKCKYTYDELFAIGKKCKDNNITDKILAKFKEDNSHVNNKKINVSSKKKGKPKI